jgi:circadian clock protein KaiC
MALRKTKPQPPPLALPKAVTGIQGLDEITQGGLPKGRPTLVCGSAGCGKTMFAMEFLVHGICEHGEPGVFVSFEETGEELAANCASLGFALPDLVARKQLVLDYVRLEQAEMEETGEYDLDGLFIRLGHAIDTIGAKRVALDTIEALFAGLSNTTILRAELRRLFRWLKDKGVTTIVTGERGDGTLTRHGLEEYVADCVILLDHRVQEQLSTRRLRVVKYRGSRHETNEYPFLITSQGLSVLPVTSMTLDHTVSTERVSSGVPRLDAMLDGQGYFRGSSILVSGTAGTGKSSLAASFADATCRRGERCVYFAFEEASAQILRNMHSIGLDLDHWVKKGLLHFHAARPTLAGLEQHLTTMLHTVHTLQPQVVVLDPVTNLIMAGATGEVRLMLMRLLDYFKERQITALFTSLVTDQEVETSEIGISSLIDTWVLLRNFEHNGERNRGLFILKSRGMAHSNQVREFMLTDQGIRLTDVYVGPEGPLMGSARATQEAREKAATLVRQHELEQQQRELERKRQEMEAQVAALQETFAREELELQRRIAAQRQQEARLIDEQTTMTRLRHADVETVAANGSSTKKGNRQGARA